MEIVNQSNNRQRNLLEQTISFIRIPLAILVIFVHSGPEGYACYNISAPVFSHIGLFTAFTNMVSFVADCAVPAFFLISGYLFAYNLNTIDFDIIKSKWQRRIKSLLIPFIFWNMMVFLWGCIIIVIISLRNGNDAFNSLIDYFSSISFYELFFSSKDYGTPIYMIMWYVRDLIALTLLAPVIFLLAKHFKLEYFLLILLLFVFSEFHVFWLKILSVFFYSMGMILSVNKINVMRCFNKSFFFFLFFALLLFSVGNSILKMPKEVSNLFQIVTVFLLFIISFYIVRWHKNFSPEISRSCFFIYCIHVFQLANQCTIVGLSSHFLQKTIGYLPFFGCYLSYIFSPILTFYICYLIYICLHRIAPQFLGIISGNYR